MKSRTSGTSTKEAKAPRARAAGLKPSVQIGKKGVTDESLKEIKKQLKKHSLIKVRFLKPALENKGRKELAMEIADKTGSELVSQIGLVATYFKEKPEKPRTQ